MDNYLKVFLHSTATTQTIPTAKLLQLRHSTTTQLPLLLKLSCRKPFFTVDSSERHTTLIPPPSDRTLIFLFCRSHHSRDVYFIFHLRLLTPSHYPFLPSFLPAFFLRPWSKMWGRQGLLCPRATQSREGHAPPTTTSAVAHKPRFSATMMVTT